jgi:hypothetical protein
LIWRWIAWRPILQTAHRPQEPYEIENVYQFFFPFFFPVLSVYLPIDATLVVNFEVLQRLRNCMMDAVIFDPLGNTFWKTFFPANVFFYLQFIFIWDFPLIFQVEVPFRKFIHSFEEFFNLKEQCKEDMFYEMKSRAFQFLLSGMPCLTSSLFHFNLIGRWWANLSDSENRRVFARTVLVWTAGAWWGKERKHPLSRTFFFSLMLLNVASCLLLSRSSNNWESNPSLELLRRPKPLRCWRGRRKELI